MSKADRALVNEHEYPGRWWSNSASNKPAALFRILCARLTAGIFCVRHWAEAAEPDETQCSTSSSYARLPERGAGPTNSKKRSANSARFAGPQSFPSPGPTGAHYSVLSRLLLSPTCSTRFPFFAKYLILVFNLRNLQQT